MQHTFVKHVSLHLITRMIFLPEESKRGLGEESLKLLVYIGLLVYLIKFPSGSVRPTCGSKQSVFTINSNLTDDDLTGRSSNASAASLHCILVLGNYRIAILNKIRSR